MKNFSFNKKNSVIRTLKEPKPIKKKWNLDRILFIGLLAILFLYLINYCYSSLFIVEAEGQISFEKLDVNFTDDIRLLDIWTNEGDSIKAGDTLFTFKNRVYDESGTDYYQFEKQQIDMLREQQKLQQQIEFKNAEIKNYSSLIEYKQTEYQESLKLVLLDVYQKNTTDNLQNEIKIMEIKREGVQMEINILKRQLKLLSNQMNFITYSGQKNGTQLESTSYYCAPINGLIGRININPNEVCYETQIALTILKPDKVGIEAFFYQESMNNVKIGDQVQIRFPDGTKSKGIINSFNISTYELPAEFQKKYEPTQRIVLADILPVNQNEENIWKKFYKMDVKISLNKLSRLL